MLALKECSTPHLFHLCQVFAKQSLQIMLEIMRADFIEFVHVSGP